MHVPLLDLKPQYALLRENLRAAIDRVIDSQQFVMGAEVATLEESIARYSQTKYAIGCASGSDALLLALMALDVKPGDEVITTAFTFFATGAAIVRVGALPVFVDIDPLTYNLDPQQVESAVTEKTRVLLPVHLYGQCVDMDALLSVAERHDLQVVEDAAQAIGAEDRGHRAGSMGSVGCFSFYPSKNLGGSGDGGMLTTNDEKIAGRLKVLRLHGAAHEFEHREVGINSRLDTLQAATLNVKFPYLEGWSNERAKKAARYTELLEDADLGSLIATPFVREEGRHIFHQYVIRVPKYRDALMEYLQERGIGTKVYYPIPLHRQECFAYLGYREGALPETESAARETMALPMFPELSETQQEYVVETIKSFSPRG
jgi:dTDP-4-amino-4,6-dideoxygalactose transaminase